MIAFSPSEVLLFIGMNNEVSMLTVAGNSVRNAVATLKGVYYEETDLLSVAVADSGSGRLVFSGEIIPRPDDDFPTSQLGGVLPFSGVRFQLDGLAADQSFIPPFVAQMSRFFREAEIDTSPY